MLSLDYLASRSGEVHGLVAIVKRVCALRRVVVVILRQGRLWRLRLHHWCGVCSMRGVRGVSSMCGIRSFRMQRGRLRRLCCPGSGPRDRRRRQRTDHCRSIGRRNNWHCCMLREVRGRVDRGTGGIQNRIGRPGVARMSRRPSRHRVVHRDRIRNTGVWHIGR